MSATRHQLILLPNNCQPITATDESFDRLSTYL